MTVAVQDRRDSSELEPAGPDHGLKDMSKLEHQEEGDASSTRPKVDKHGLPLIPQPSEWQDDPLNWSFSSKLAVLLQISLLALTGNMSAAVVNPAYVPLGKAFGITTVQASYQLTVYLVFAAIGPLMINPLAVKVGRRPIYLLGTLLCACTNIAAGYCTSWSSLLATRVFNGIGGGATLAMGAATICDLYFVHERGLYMGVYTFFLTNGPHIAPLVGGYVASRMGWSECYKIPSYIQFGLFGLNLLALPETLYDRTAETGETYHNNTFLRLVTFRPLHMPKHTVHPRDFVKPLRMLKYVAIWVPTLYYMTAFSYGSVIFALTGAHVFREAYGFGIESTGLMLSVPLLVGCLIGEANAGWFTDWLVYRHAKRHGGERSPEARLDALWFALLLPIGVIVQGVCISHSKQTGWIGNAMGMGIASFGLQVATTCVYSYTTDCYKQQSSEISAILNLFRMIFSALVSFYAVPLANKIQYQYAWLVLAMINIVFLIPLFYLRYRGKKIRSAVWQAPPAS